MSLTDARSLQGRAEQLASANLNGFDFVLVSLPTAADPPEAHLEVHFRNANRLPAILASAAPPKTLFPITGGHRVRAGQARGEVQVVDLLAPAGAPDNVLQLVVRPIGDYSTYTLGVGPAVAGFDPVFDEIGFKFRPGCFSIDCSPERETASPRPSDPRIDYLAKDYDSFRHLLMSWMEHRVPGWQPSSEADLSQVLISLMSAAADELSDYQDRVMNEAYLATARKRVSLARHARLLDYHVHQGNQAFTWIAVELDAGAVVQPGDQPGDDVQEIEVWAGRAALDDDSVVFRGRCPELHHLLNAISLHTWSGARPGLAAGATEADLAMPSHASAETVRDLIAAGTIERLLIQEHRDPLTGNPAGADPEKRQLLRLERKSVEVRKDPLTGHWMVHVSWRHEDQLRHDYCFTVHKKDGLFDDVSAFHGNLLQVFQGRLVRAVFTATGQTFQPAAGEPSPDLVGHTEPTQPEVRGEEESRTRWGTLCRLPADRPVLYTDTAPRSERPPVSTLAVEVDGAPWREVISLVGSDDSDRHFAVETDEVGRSVVRFGNGVHGENLPPEAVVRCLFQSGRGPDGNVGRDRVRHFDRGRHPKIHTVWNPFDVTNGRAPETREKILRSAPEAYRTRQLRAITLADYVQRAEEVPGVARAAASYAWTGSWRTVRVTVDPLGTPLVRPALRAAVARHLEPVRLIGEDLEIRPPIFIPVEIDVVLCVDSEVWPEDVRAVLEQEFSDGYTPDGRAGFFHPDRWTFGQTLFASQILGRMERVPGVSHALSVRLARWGAATPGSGDRVEVGANEIIQVLNDPDHMERGSISFEFKGGRR